MAIQTLTLNVNAQPSAEDRAFLYLSQNENGRDIRFRVLGDDLPSGCTATLSGVKPDGNVWSKAGTVTNNFVVVEEDVQMTAVAGRWDAQLDIVNGSKNIVTALIRITVEAAAVEAGAVPSDTQLEGYVEQCKQYAETAKNEAYGSPLTAATAAAMTDQSRVYVYTGSETGYTAGHWYYHNGTSWTDGGVYNAVAVDTDTTLSVSGKAADAKKTGDELSTIKENLTALTTKEVVFVDGFSVKTIDGTLFANNRFSYAEIKVATIAGGKINGYTRCERSVNAGIAFYDEYGQFISGEQNPTANTYTWNITNITIPSNAVLLRISCRTDYKTDFNIKFTWEHFDNNIENFIIFANEILIKHPNYRYYGETLSFVRNGYNIKQLFAVPAVPSGATTRQGFAIFNGVLFQFFGNNKVSLINMETSDTITTLDVVSEHGDTADFSNDYYNQDDEFPLLYVTADTTPAKVYVNRITRESATLIRTLYFPDTAKTGYYAGHCLDAEANILYIVGYTNSSYDTDDGTNKMIVSSWDVTKLTENQDGTFTPSFIELFNTDFISTVQGQSVLNHRLFLLSSRVTSPHETTIFVVDPSKHIISTVISNFPNDIKNVECEGVGFAVSSDGNRYDLIMSGNNYYSIQFT
jgi:hypothetical protein